MLISASCASMFWAATRPVGPGVVSAPPRALATTLLPAPPPRSPGSLICGAGTGSAHPCLPMTGAEVTLGPKLATDVQCLDWVRKGPASRGHHVRCDSDTSPDWSGLRRGAGQRGSSVGEARTTGCFKAETERGVASLFDRGPVGPLQLDVCDRLLDPPG